MFHMWGTAIGFWPFFGGIWMLIFWGGIIVLIVWGVKKLAERPGGGRAAGGIQPLDIARERYARGEITCEEFEQIKKDIA